MQPKQKRCARCGLHYDEVLDKCSHCGDLDDGELELLLKRKEAEAQGNTALGKTFLIVAGLIAALLLMSVLQG
jgi:hypothetical protein